jgi:hypothetical protein
MTQYISGTPHAKLKGEEKAAEQRACQQEKSDAFIAELRQPKSAPIETELVQQEEAAKQRKTAPEVEACGDVDLDALFDSNAAYGADDFGTGSSSSSYGKK